MIQSRIARRRLKSAHLWLYRAASFCSFVGSVYLTTLYTSCAVVRAPNGGPKDTIPPKVLGTIPRNFTTNYKGTKVTILFDEYVKIKDPNTSVFISPETDKPANIRVFGKSIIVEFKSDLEKNRTYSINFGNSIVDYNEGNELKNYHFVFATGKKIDSLQITGHVTDQLDTTAQKDIFVILHKVGNDSAIINKKPLLFTTTDKEGNFVLSNIANGIYNLYALKETNKNKKYDSKAESIAFLEHPIVLNKDTSGVLLKLFKEEETKLKVIKKSVSQGVLSVALNKPLDSIQFRVLAPIIPNKKYIIEKNAKGDTSYIWLTSLKQDSIRVGIYEKGQQVLTVSQTNYAKEKKIPSVSITDNLANGLIRPGTGLVITFSRPLEKLTNRSISLIEDSSDVAPDSVIDLTSLHKTFGVYFPWQTKSKYTVLIKKDGVTDLFGTTNKEFKKTFTLGQERNYGTIHLSAETPGPGQYIIQLMDQNFKTLKSIIVSQSSKINYTNLDPGKYRVRVIYDRIANGKYDTGDLIKKIQPEKIVTSKEITIRANFEQNANFPLPKDN